MIGWLAKGSVMRYMINIGAAGPGRDPRTMTELAALAEASGWDGITLEDYIVYQGNFGMPTYDPWVVLAAMAMATTRLLLGTLVTPLPRRRPWRLASEAVTLDHLSAGRLILGVGAGDSKEPSFVDAGEPTDPRVLAEMLDEGLAILAGLWTGEPVTYAGKHYHVSGLSLAPRPVQQPRIPIWIGGDWLVAGVRRRLTRWDGCCVYAGTPGTAKERPITGDDVRGIVSLIERERGTTEGSAICVGGSEPDPDRERQRAYVQSLADAGATWWNMWIPPCDPEKTREAISRRPVRID
jgi:alkanesulfonate monooxygenase SsuD/methylene tetrahydromethanopterin reductase-like flavin-dependent oxidoreductase (luciferase family)